MGSMLLGMLFFFSAHSVRIFAEPWRQRMIARLGPLGWKGLYALVSLLGLVLMVRGYATTLDAPELWQPPPWAKHIAILLTLPAFVLIVAAYLPASHFKSLTGHPMLLGVKLWALGHLLANGRAADMLLFGAFLLWAIADFAAARRRDRAAGRLAPAASLRGDSLVLVVGLAAWGGFALFLHLRLIGVAPLG